MWWQGPKWLQEPKSTWKFRNLSPLETDLEARKLKTHASFFSNYEDVLDRFSSLDRALRVISYLFRFFNMTHPAKKGRYTFSDRSISSSEIEKV